ncbi:hypothetical protein [Pseudomonas moraviensis]|uniref:Uncharacterized protein n=1 Tax=Pseudomonas moraviensis TaxID=321662 RepID=A0A7Y9W233_9PSED|nr:hypothetical protein [Pseudomonas moraviensis]NYH12315.1 hypothetical protein [Pseudomonas moraviensis]
MSRVSGKKYSSSTLSGYKTKEEAEQHVLSNYSSVPVEVQNVGSDFVFYFEDPNGVLYIATPNDSVMRGVQAEEMVEFSSGLKGGAK